MKKIFTLYLLLSLLLANGCAPIIVMGPSYPQEPQKKHYSINIPKGTYLLLDIAASGILTALPVNNLLPSAALLH